MKKKILLIIMMAVNLNFFAQDLPVNGNLSVNGDVGIGTTTPIEKLDLRGNLNINSGIDDNHIYWERHNMTMGTKPGDYAHNIFKLKPGGASNGMLFSLFQMYKANSESSHDLKLQLHTNGNSYFNGGNVGIGTSNPDSKLEIMDGNIHINKSSTSGTYKIRFRDHSASFGYDSDGSSIGQYGAYIATSDTSKHIYIAPSGVTKFTFKSNGNMGIGTTSPDSKLSVNGKIHTKEVKVDLIGWSDFVFENDYKLPTLSEVENHIKEKGHLKDIPSAKEVENNGIFLGEMNAKLLQKIEELTLYTIQQEKKIEELNNIKFKVLKLEKENIFLKNINLNVIELQKRLDKLEKN